MEELEGILQEYVATANNPEYNSDWETINSKFPELKDYDPELLQDYVATANNPEYNSDWSVINSKFPEFNTTGDLKGVQPVQNGESSSVSGDSKGLLDSESLKGTRFSKDPSFIFDLYPLDKDYQHMGGTVERRRREHFARMVDNDPKMKQELEAIKATGNEDEAYSLRESFINELYYKYKPETERDRRNAEMFKDFPKLDMPDETNVQRKYREMSEREDFKYKSEKVFTGEKDSDGDVVSVDSGIIKDIYGDLGSYGIDVEDFNSFIESGNDRIKKLSRAGYFTTDTTDILLDAKEEKQLREAAKNKALMNYVGDRIVHLRGKHLGLTKSGNIEEAKAVEAQIKETAMGYQNYVSENLPNYKEEYEKKLIKEYNTYLQSGDIGAFKSSLNTGVDALDSFGNGILDAAGDISAYLADIVGADDSAEYQRMINDYNTEFENNSLSYGIVSGKKVKHNGKNYLTTDEGRIIDTDAGKEITAIADRLNIDKEAILNKGKESQEEDTSYSASGLIVKGSNVLGNLAFQLAATRGAGGTLGVSSRTGTVITSMAVQSGMVSSSVYEETLSQLRDANINDDKAKGEALELSLKMGAVTAMTSVLSPNTSALGVTKKSVDKQLAAKLASSYVAGGKDAFKTTLWNHIKEKGIAMTREGFEETLQELTETVSQKYLNSGINEDLGKDVLGTEITKDELIETFLLSHSTAGLMAINGKTNSDFKDRLSILEFFSKDVNESEKFINEFKNEGAVSQDMAAKMITDIKNYNRYSNQVPKDTPISKIEPLIGLLSERGKLEDRKKVEDKAFHKEINEKIDAVDTKIAELRNGKTDEETTSEPQENTQPTNVETPKQTEEGGQQATDAETVLEEETEAPVDKDTKESYKKVADTIRQAKFYKTPSEAMSKLQSDPTGLFKGVWDGAVETVATGIELTGSLDSAIRKGVKYVKESDWYKNLSPDGKKKALEMFEAEARTNLKPFADSMVKKPKVSPKTQTRKTTGQTDTSAKVQTTEAKLLKDKFKNLQRGYKTGVKETRAIKSSFIKDVTRALKTLKGSIPTGKVNSILSRVNQVSETNIDKIKGDLDYLVEQIESKRVKDSGEASRRKVKKMAKIKANTTPQSLKNLAKRVSEINPKFLTADQIGEFNKLVGTIGDSFKSVTSKGYKPLKESDLEDTINSLEEAAYKKETADYLAEVGGELEGLNNQIWSNDKDFQELVDSKNKEQKRRIKDKLIGMLSERVATVTNPHPFISRLRKADLASMPSSLIKRAIKVVDNYNLNEDLSGYYDIESYLKAKENVKETKVDIAKRGLPITNIVNGVFTSLNTLALNFKKMFGDTKVAARFNRASGLASLSSNNQIMKNELNDIQSKLDEVFKKAKKINKEVMSAENRIYRGIVKELIQGSNPKDFDRNKARIEQHIKYLEGNSSKQNKKIAEKYKQEYAKLEALTTQQEVLDFLKSSKDGNNEIVQFWLGTFEGLKDRLKTNTEEVHGERMAGFVDNYLPISTVFVGTGTDPYLAEGDGRPTFMADGVLEPKPVGNTKARTKTATLPSNRVLNMDFDSTMLKSVFKVLEDIHLSKSKKDVSNYFDILSSEGVLAKETSKSMQDKLKEMFDIYSRKPQNSDEISKFVNKTEKVVRRMATRLALGTIIQYPKQYTVAMNVMGRLGSNAGLMMTEMFSSSKDIPLLDMYSIASRADQEAGISRKVEKVSQAGDNKVIRGFAKKVSEPLSKLTDGLDNVIFYSLKKGDVNVARSSWIAFYKDYLKRSGKVDMKTLDMKTEHELIGDDKIRQDAASYAELMVEETQISSDDARGSTLYNDKNVGMSILRSIFMPYQRFNINAKARMIIDIDNLVKGGRLKDAKLMKDAAQSLGSTVAEQVTFLSLKIYALSLLTSAGTDLLRDFLELEEPEEDEDKKARDAEFKNTKFISGLAKDLNPLAIGETAENLWIEFANFATYLHDDSEVKEDSGDYYEWTKKYKKENGSLPFYRYGDKNGFDVEQSFGLYQAPFQKLNDLIESYELANSDEYGDVSLRNQYGAMEEYSFTEEQQKLMKYNFVADLLSLTVGMEAESLRALNRLKREQKKEAKQ